MLFKEMKLLGNSRKCSVKKNLNLVNVFLWFVNKCLLKIYAFVLAAELAKKKF
jgi:hypothetical protein